MAEPGRSTCGGKRVSGPAGAATKRMPRVAPARSSAATSGGLSPDTVRAPAGGVRARAGRDATCAPGASGGVPRWTRSASRELPCRRTARWPRRWLRRSPERRRRPGSRWASPENPGPTPVASTAGPETRTRMRGPSDVAAPSTTSMISASKLAGSIPRITDSAVHFIPARTSARGMIGSAARAEGASTARAMRLTTNARAGDNGEKTNSCAPYAMRRRRPPRHTGE
jgi:hypothetical protein